MGEIELRRKALQDRLDAGKTHKERNLLGQFSTPYPLAYDIMLYLRRLMGSDDVSFIEPAIGTGVFYSAYKDLFVDSKERVLGFEIDPYYFIPTQQFWHGTDLDIRCADFLSQQPDGEYDMLVANPPYVRHHYIVDTVKQRLKGEVLREYGLNISGLAGLYCYFMILSLKWLKDGGISCWLVPGEFMDVNYGVVVKEFLLQNVELIHIHRFNINDLQFSDALVSSCIVVFRNHKPTGSQPIRFSSGGSINNPETSKTLVQRQLSSNTKWSHLFGNDVISNVSGATLGDFFTVKRGIATGDNDFFILDKKTIAKYSIPDIFLRPLLPSPRYIKGYRIESENGLPIVDRQIFLFSCNLPENILQKEYPKVWEYICEGFERGVQDGYICSRRSPWYSCEKREPASIILPYMGRSETNNQLFRFILNSSSAITTNVYLMLYPKPQYAQCMRDENVLMGVWRELNSIPTETLSRNGRYYGGGLRKIEPKELMNTPAEGIASLLVPNSTGYQLSIFD